MFLDTPTRRYHQSGPGLSALALLALAFSAGLVAGALVLRSPPVRVAPVDRASTQREPPVWTRDGNPVIRQPVEVLHMIDGDTFEARVHLWPGLEIITRVRLRGVDAPELKARCAEEERMAKEAAAALKALLDEGGVTIFNIGPDKYNGRVVADAATRTTADVSAALLNSGYVRRYGGGRRRGWCNR